MQTDYLSMNRVTWQVNATLQILVPATNIYFNDDKLSVKCCAVTNVQIDYAVTLKVYQLVQQCCTVTERSFFAHHFEN